MVAKLFLAFTLVPMVELYILIEVGKRIGSGTTIMIIVLTGWLGAYLAKREGLRVYTEFQKKINSGQMPGDTLIEGVLILGGGVLLITPGYLSDVAGIALMVPPIRRFIAGRLKEYYARKMRRQAGIIDIEPT